MMNPLAYFLLTLPAILPQTSTGTHTELECLGEGRPGCDSPRVLPRLNLEAEQTILEPPRIGVCACLLKRVHRPSAHSPLCPVRMGPSVPRKNLETQPAKDLTFCFPLGERKEGNWRKKDEMKVK